ncbi:hypothetical protein [Candidatus Amarolinea dominans]|uniref:hypothetical protein n=1 Tax=Candidatus Amarolinea dominans TaxID=3140696 RepID=UPI0031356BC3|nr:hypothetical protein [Anaerolineae bacterium]
MAVGEGGGEEQGEQGGRIEPAGLHIGHVRRAQVEVRVPEREMAGVQTALREGVDGVEERGQVAAVSRGVGHAAELLPEEGGRGQGQEADPPPGAAPGRPPALQPESQAAPGSQNDQYDEHPLPFS